VIELHASTGSLLRRPPQAFLLSKLTGHVEGSFLLLSRPFPSIRSALPAADAPPTPREVVSHSYIDMSSHVLATGEPVTAVFGSDTLVHALHEPQRPRRGPRALQRSLTLPASLLYKSQVLLRCTYVTTVHVGALAAAQHNAATPGASRRGSYEVEFFTGGKTVRAKLAKLTHSLADWPRLHAWLIA
jgi:hypothetical protein